MMWRTYRTSQWSYLITGLLIGPITTNIAQAQFPYTAELFGSAMTDMDTEYGTAQGFDGVMDTLRLDVYKPVGDANCLRPLMVFVHGGAWIEGDKADPAVQQICHKMAARGWVVASINYRMGMHVTSSYTPYALCGNSPFNDCVRVADTAEVYRAIYRGMQDAKGAIRFMKNRAGVDSTDINNVFISGASAGAFIALSTAFTDDPSEKPAQCLAVSDAPVGDPDLPSCVIANADLSRPDLGPVEGTLHLGFGNASVKGVASFAGGMLDTSIVQGVDTPTVYLFHQTNDIIVRAGRSRLLAGLNGCLGGLCQPFFNMPISYGGNALKNAWLNGNNAPNYQADVVHNWTGTILDCTANGHAVDNNELRITNMCQLFSPVITISGNDPATNCLTVGVNDGMEQGALQVFPNPSNQRVLHLNCVTPISELDVLDLAGHSVLFRSYQTGPDSHRIELQKGINGVVLVRTVSKDGEVVVRRVVML